MDINLDECDEEQVVKLYEYKKPMELFENSKMVKICAPMVRYTKTLVKKYDCDLLYTPMIMSDSFTRSQKARDNEFSTNPTDRPLIIQFAASNVNDFGNAAEFAYYSKSCDGIEINCGCPQKWAIQEGIGSALIQKNDLICEMVKEAQKRLNYDKDFTIAVKIRLHEDINQTIDLCRKLDAIGCSYLTIHARTPKERHEPIHLDELKLAVDNVKSMPCVANGDLFSLEDCKKICDQVNVKGVMCARGLLENPAMFAGYDLTPKSCIQDWIDICFNYGTPFAYFHSVLTQMLQHLLSKSERRYFNSLISATAVLDYLNEKILVD